VTNRERVPKRVPPGSDRDAQLVSDLFAAFAVVVPPSDADAVRRVGHALAEATAGPPTALQPDPDQPPEPRG
jgi:hypothetical protein